jgi:CRP-like cAMP-binding protein
MSEKADYKTLCKTTVGEELSEEECQVLAGIIGVRKMQNNEMLVKENEKDDTLFILTEGKLAVVGNALGNEIVLYTMKVGECAGTRAFVDRTPRKATLRSVGNATIYTLEPEDFESLLKSHPVIVYKVMRALFRITHTNLMRMNQESQELANYVTKTRGRY